MPEQEKQTAFEKMKSRRRLLFFVYLCIYFATVFLGISVFQETSKTVYDIIILVLLMCSLLLFGEVSTKLIRRGKYTE